MINVMANSNIFILMVIMGLEMGFFLFFIKWLGSSLIICTSTTGTVTGLHETKDNRTLQTTNTTPHNKATKDIFFCNHPLYSENTRRQDSHILLVTKHDTLHDTNMNPLVKE